MLYGTLVAFALARGVFSSTVALLKDRQAQSLASSTQNGLQGACKPVIVIFARGTTEAGNVGSIVGPPLAQAIAQKIGANNLAFQGVEYPADVPGYLAGGDAKGSKDMANMVSQTVEKCPDSAVIMSGYSQGGQLVHNAAKALPPAVTAKVAGALIFGDPNNGTPVQGVPADKTLVVCHGTDGICNQLNMITQAHLTYGQQNAGDGAKFVATMYNAFSASKANSGTPSAGAAAPKATGHGRRRS